MLATSRRADDGTLSRLLHPQSDRYSRAIKALHLCGPKKLHLICRTSNQSSLLHNSGFASFPVLERSTSAASNPLQELLSSVRFRNTGATAFVLALVGQARELPFQSAANRRQRSIAGVNPSYLSVITQYSPALALATPVSIYVLVQVTNVCAAMQMSSCCANSIRLRIHTPSVCAINDLLEMSLCLLKPVHQCLLPVVQAVYVHTYMHIQHSYQRSIGDAILSVITQYTYLHMHVSYQATALVIAPVVQTVYAAQA
eukprot:scaffold11736_cov186-Skeletonema_dohrnii-CCMP3373.AAC.1